MDIRTGRIYTEEEMEAKGMVFSDIYMRPMTLPPTVEQMKRAFPKVGRNDPCPCGSGKKFKHCCRVVREKGGET